MNQAGHSQAHSHPAVQTAVQREIQLCPAFSFFLPSFPSFFSIKITEGLTFSRIAMCSAKISGGQNYLGAPGVQHRTHQGMYGGNERLYEEESKRKLFAHTQTRFLSVEKGSFKDALQGQVWEFFDSYYVTSFLSRKRWINAFWQTHTTQIIHSQPSHTIQFKRARK